MTQNVSGKSPDRKSTRLNSSHTRRSSDLSFAGGMVWARNITSHYPAEGLRLPYHLYLDDPERLREIARSEEHTSELQSYTTLFRSKLCRRHGLGAEYNFTLSG